MAEDKKELLVAAAIRQFERSGYHATKVSDIVQEAGVAQGTFYLYFKSKEHLFHSIAESCLGAIAESLENRQAGNPCSVAGIADMIEQVLRVYSDNRSILRIIYKHGMASNELGDITEQFYGRLAAHIRAICMRDGYHQGYSDEELELVAYAHIGMVERVAYQWFIVRNADSSQIDMVTRILAAEAASGASPCIHEDGGGDCG